MKQAAELEGRAIQAIEKARRAVTASERDKVAEISAGFSTVGSSSRTELNALADKSDTATTQARYRSAVRGLDGIYSLKVEVKKVLDKAQYLLLYWC